MISGGKKSITGQKRGGKKVCSHSHTSFGSKKRQEIVEKRRETGKRKSTLNKSEKPSTWGVYEKGGGGETSQKTLFKKDNSLFKAFTGEKKENTDSKAELCRGKEGASVQKKGEGSQLS